MGISASDVNKLRKATGAGMMDCKKALEESGGDFDAAVDFLRKKGQKVSAKRSEREASEGQVIAKTGPDRKKGILVSVNCETDFVAKNEDFIKFAEDVANKALETFPENLDKLLEQTIDGKSISSHLEEKMGKIGEKIEISDYYKLEGEDITAYNHLNNKIGVLVSLSGSVPVQTGRDIAMQVAAMSPIAIDEDGIPKDVVDRELEIAKDQIKQEGKPEHLLDKIARGKLKKFFKENTLLNQQFVKDPSQTVSQVLSEVNSDLKITGFKRISVGSN